MKPKRKPVAVGRSGSVIIPIYRNQWKDDQGRPRHGYIVKYRLHGQQKPVQIKRATLADAKTIADEAAHKIAAGQSTQLLLHNDDVAIYRRIIESAAPVGKPPEIIIAEYREILQLLPPGTTARECILDYAKRHPVEIIPKTMAQLVPLYLQTKRAEDPNLSEKYFEDLEDRLNAAAKHFVVPIHKLTSSDFSLWLVGLRHFKTGAPLAPQTRINHITCLSDFFSSDTAKAHLPKEWNELKQVKRPKVVRGKIQIFTIEELTTLLYGAAGFIALPTAEAIREHPSLEPLARPEKLSKTARKKLERQKESLRLILPYLALGAFGSTRNDFNNGEISELDWSQIDFKRRTIDMDDGIAKGSDRHIPMPSNLIEWLRPYAKTTGPVIPKNCRKLRELLCHWTGIKWVWNGLRHSCISYRQALIKDIEEVAADAGNSPEMIHQRYRKALPRSEGKRWSNIRPPRQNNIVSIFGGTTKAAKQMVGNL